MWQQSTYSSAEVNNDAVLGPVQTITGVAVDMLGLTPLPNTVPTPITRVGCNASGRHFFFLLSFRK